jgi:hypothetical protein
MAEQKVSVRQSKLIIEKLIEDFRALKVFRQYPLALKKRFISKINFTSTQSDTNITTFINVS